jgi:hypothetical protein
MSLELLKSKIAAMDDANLAKLADAVTAEQRARNLRRMCASPRPYADPLGAGPRFRSGDLARFIDRAGRVQTVRLLRQNRKTWTCEAVDAHGLALPHHAGWRVPPTMLSHYVVPSATPVETPARAPAVAPARVVIGTSSPAFGTF